MSYLKRRALSSRFGLRGALSQISAGILQMRKEAHECPSLFPQFPSDTDRMLKKSALIDSLQELEWITEDAKKQVL